jgi:hypothetical protein
MHNPKCKKVLRIIILSEHQHKILAFMVTNITAMFLAVEKIKLSRIINDILVYNIPSHYRVNICKGEKPIYTHYFTMSLRPQREI